jgi:AraC-like DNA-binding protein
LEKIDASAEIDRAEPVDLSCGILLPIRWSKHCAIYHYDRHDACTAPRIVEDKPFEMHVFVQTTRGRWDFHGKRGAEAIDRSTLVAGVKGDHYGCGHDRLHGDGNLIASLRAHALDEDLQLFDRQTLALDLTVPLERALAAPELDRFESLVFEMFNLVSDRSLGDARVRQSNRLRMQRVKRFIEDHAFEDVTLDDIAASVNLSPFTCLRQFKVHAGTTPHAYLGRLRLERARELLRTSTFEVGEVGKLVGMRDQCYFSRWFAKEVGASPTQFRRDAR